tara:strand:+ start:10215 stop:10643 length:429 start_codon:yes stop_codon:yes gene_type:complete
MSWFKIIKEDDYDEARRILNRPMEVEDWMKRTMKPHTQHRNCCEYTQEKFKLMPNYRNVHEDIQEFIMGINCKNNEESDTLLLLLENIDEDGMELMNDAMIEEGLTPPSISELDANVKAMRELLKFWQTCEAESTDKRGVPQ